MTAASKKCPTCGESFGQGLVFCPKDGGVLEAGDDAMTGRVIADRYRVLSKIGEGGMGQVFLAEHVHMKRKCAVKFLNPDLAGNAGALKRFIREASNASQIDHPNVVTIYDFGEAEYGSVYLAMEYVEGETLRNRIDSHGILPHETIASIVRQTAAALHAAHQLDIVHRDLKPDNIMLVYRDDSVRVKVVDFGIAKAKGADQKVTVTGAIVGTPDYMSPEQVTGADVDGRSDQYALALVAVKLLTGKLPFATATGIESLTSRLMNDPLPLRELRTDIVWPQQLQDVIGKALSSEPEQRFANVLDFSRAFDKALGHLHGALAATLLEIPLGSEPIPPTRKREASRRRSIAPFAAAAAVLIIAGGAGAIWIAQSGDGPAKTEQMTHGLVAMAGTAPESSAADSAPVKQGSTGEQKALEVAAQSPTTSLLSKAGETRPVEETKAASRAAKTPPPPADTQAGAAPATKGTSATKEAGKTTTPPPSSAAEPRDTQPAAPAPKPAAPQTLSSSEVAGELAEVRKLMTPDSPASTLAKAVATLNAVLPRTGQRSDSIRIFYTRAQAQALQEDLGGACKTLSTALGLAKGSSLETAITRTAEQLSCP